LSTFKSGWIQGFPHGGRELRDKLISADLESVRKNAADVTISRWTGELMTKVLHDVHQDTRSELISIFGKYPYVGLSIHRVTIKSRKLLNIDVVNLVSDTLTFTYDFLEDRIF
jgi:hypothetical protein